MSMWVHLVSEPIQQESPAGSDPRYEPEYDALQGELRKLTAMTGGRPDWQLVVDSAACILREKGKDIPVAVYLAIGLGRTAGFAGWIEGTQALCALLNQWWQAAFPPLKRLKGRINALEWWQEQSLLLLQQWTDAPPWSAEVLDAARHAVADLDSALGALMPDMPPLRAVKEAVDALPALPAPVLSPTASLPAEAGFVSEPLPAEVLAADKAALSSAAPSPSAASSSAERGIVPAQSPLSPPSVLFPVPVVNADTDGASACAAVRSFADSVLLLLTTGESLPAAPPLWQALYAGVLGRISALPPAEDGRTAIPAPESSVLTNAAKLLEGGNAVEAAQAVLSFLPQSPLWFSLHFLLFQALQAAGGEYAATARTVHACCRLCAANLGGVADLAYEDGTPFATGEARQWLCESGGKTCAAPDPVAALEAQARALLSEEKPFAALDLLEAAAQPRDRREYIRRRLAQAGLLRSTQQWNIAAGIADELVEASQYFHLEEWEPALAFSIWACAYQVRIGLGMDAEAGEALRRAAGIDPAGALRLVS